VVVNDEFIITNMKIEKITSQHNESYHHSPTKEQGKEFHKKGLSIIRISDIPNIVSFRYSI